MDSRPADLSGGILGYGDLHDSPQRLREWMKNIQGKASAAYGVPSCEDGGEGNFQVLTATN